MRLPVLVAPLVPLQSPGNAVVPSVSVCRPLILVPARVPLKVQLPPAAMPPIWKDTVPVELTDADSTNTTPPSLAIDYGGEAHGPPGCRSAVRSESGSESRRRTPGLSSGRRIRHRAGRSRRRLEMALAGETVTAPAAIQGQEAEDDSRSAGIWPTDKGESAWAPPSPAWVGRRIWASLRSGQRRTENRQVGWNEGTARYNASVG